jgi:hypothetical protein
MSLRVVSQWTLLMFALSQLKLDGSHPQMHVLVQAVSSRKRWQSESTAATRIKKKRIFIVFYFL